jgi:hypothetical protein
VKKSDADLLNHTSDNLAIIFKRTSMCLLGVHTCDSASLVGDNRSPIPVSAQFAAMVISALGSLTDGAVRNRLWKAKRTK